MIWFSKINSDAFKNWLIGTSQGNIKQERLDPFATSLRVFYNAHDRMQKQSKGQSMGVSDVTQFKSDLQAAELFNKATDNLSTLGVKVLKEWDSYGITPSDEDYEIHRCLIVISNGLYSGSSLYKNFVKFWKVIRTHFSFNHLIANPEYLYLISYLNKDLNGYNPFNAMTGLKMTDTDLVSPLNWTTIKNHYANDAQLVTAVDKYSNAIQGWVTRKKGRISFCTALEILTNRASAETIINGLSIDNVKKDILRKILKELSNNNNMALNQILYGPPGTGKTHNAINHALSIVTGRDVNEIISEQKVDSSLREKAKTEFDELVTKGQIQFVTFHQSYSYEDFVEGIKSVVNSNGDVEYRIENGIFKKICMEAGKRKSPSLSFEDAYDSFTQEVNNGGGKFVLKTLIQSKPFNVKISSLGNSVAIPQTKDATEMTITKSNLKAYIEHGTIKDWKTYTTTIGDYITKKYISKSSTVDNSDKNYVLIIDEINRGNISKIFGELITLIEKSKRVGETEALKVKLTYSGTENQEDFGVPNNLFIVGTMNSADKSIALVDTALRRRFEFIEYSADHTLLSNDIEGINLQELLKTINSRIEILLDKDHKIGHAYLINVQSKNQLCEVFRNKILPLLEEYFYGDYEKIQLVLGDNAEFNKVKENKVVISNPSSDQRNLFGKDIDGFEEKTIYQLNENITLQNYDAVLPDFFISIYKKTPKPV